jgi:transketolase
MVSQIVAAKCPKKVINLSLPDAPVVTGKSSQVFDYYGLNAEGIVKTVTELI